MADRPILFSAPMVRALLAGTKTQTRRTAGVPTIEQTDLGAWHVHNRHGGEFQPTLTHAVQVAHDYLPIQPGDRLWVKETWRTFVSLDGEKPIALWRQDGPRGAGILYEADSGSMALTADGERTYGDRDDYERRAFGKTRVSLHMPRWASRLTLKVTDVRVQRLQEISSADSIAEGCRPHANLLSIDCDTPDPRDDYRGVWETINGVGSWDKNPWVAGYTFTVERANIDQARAAA